MNAKSVNVPTGFVKSIVFPTIATSDAERPNPMKAGGIYIINIWHPWMIIHTRCIMIYISRWKDVSNDIVIKSIDAGNGAILVQVTYQIGKTAIFNNIRRGFIDDKIAYQVSHTIFRNIQIRI